jgi:hypothetical protein
MRGSAGLGSCRREGEVGESGGKGREGKWCCGEEVGSRGRGGDAADG